jgi:hypothetical protein
MGQSRAQRGYRGTLARLRECCIGLSDCHGNEFLALAGKLSCAATTRSNSG